MKCHGSASPARGHTKCKSIKGRPKPLKEGRTPNKNPGQRNEVMEFAWRDNEKENGGKGAGKSPAGALAHKPCCHTVQDATELAPRTRGGKEGKAAK